MTVINPNFTATNSAHLHLSAAFPAEIASEQIPPTYPSVSRTTFPYKKLNPGGIYFFFPRQGTVQEYFLSLCPGRFSFTERLRVPWQPGAGNDARNKEPGPKPCDCSLPEPDPAGDEVCGTDGILASGSAGGRGGQSHVPRSDPQSSPRLFPVTGTRNVALAGAK